MRKKTLWTVLAGAAMALVSLNASAHGDDAVAGMIVGGGIGAAVGGPPGAAVGAILGSLIASDAGHHPHYRDRYSYDRGYDDRGYRGPPPVAYRERYERPRYYEPAPAYYEPRAYRAPPPQYAYGARYDAPRQYQRSERYEPAYDTRVERRPYYDDRYYDPRYR